MNNLKEKNVAIYARKSKEIEDSESIEAQIDYCKKYATLKFVDCKINHHIYIDNGKSGANTNRPEFQQMKKELREKKINTVLCYKVDRISRSLADFTNFMQELTQKQIGITACQEGFSSDDAIGRMVLSILMIFAQLERDNITERIKTVMLYNAREGKWTGGTPVIGYTAKRAEFINEYGKKKKTTILVPVDEEIKFVQYLYDLYLETRSLSKIETILMQKQIKTKNEKDYKPSSIREILRNPTFVIADEDIYNYFKEQGSDVIGDIEEFNNEFGIMPYNRQNKNKSKNDKTKASWIIAVGMHQGFISSDKWIKVQNILDQNYKEIPRLGTSQDGLFGGMIYCKHCSGIMKVRRDIKKKDGVQNFYYTCSKKTISRGTACEVKNINGLKLEKDVLDYIDKLVSDNNLLDNYIKKNNLTKIASEGSKTNEIELLKKNIQKNSLTIENLVVQLGELANTTSSKYIADKIDILHKSNEKLEQKVLDLKTEIQERNNREIDINNFIESLQKISSINKIQNLQIKRNLIKTLIKDFWWDGNEITVNFFLDNLCNYDTTGKVSS